MWRLFVDDLWLDIEQEGESVHVLRGVTFEVSRAERVGIVGESGSGKTMTARTIMRLLPHGTVITKGAVSLNGVDLFALAESRFHKDVRGREIAIIFQDARAALNPLLPIGKQVAEVYKQIHGGSDSEASKATTNMLRRVALPNPDHLRRAFPHELSGGMCQRVMIAMALVCSPNLLIADEPTSGLDVTIQVQILDLILDVIADLESQLIVISHDMSVISKSCNRSVVMYCGQVVEAAATQDLLDAPIHPYAKGLVRCFGGPKRGLMPYVKGVTPDLRILTSGCPFASRCEEILAICSHQPPKLIDVGDRHYVACHLRGQRCHEITVHTRRDS